MFKTVLIPIDLSHAEAGKEMIGAAKRIGGEGVQIILINVVEDIPTYVAVRASRGGIWRSQLKVRRRPLRRSRRKPTWRPALKCAQARSTGAFSPRRRS